MLKRLQALIAQTQSGDRLPTIPTSSMTQQDVPIDPASQSFVLQVQQERLRQAHQSFNLSLVVLVSTTILGFTGTGLLLAGKTTEGSVAATGSLLSSLCGLSLKLAKDAGDRIK
jgi:hypothetical protein